MSHSHSEERTFECVPEIMIQLHQALCKLVAALMEYLDMTSSEGVGYQARREENSKRWRNLDWEKPEEVIKSFIMCLRQQNKILREDFSQERKNLSNLAKHLWKYLLLDNSTRIRAFSSMYRDGVWRQFAMRYGTTFEERIQHLLQFFTVFASKLKPQASQLTRSDDDINLEKYGILNEYSESL
ncbi:unnamed protein product [Pocillopora meandrina]|uniref:Uncharacterized protein n=1 Tax=Pocillopora meandrina TaxID=46732 RepID=A0AAU9VLR5_9CNID|nr:unnamed protein product [Pocillopora meandrina]